MIISFSIKIISLFILIELIKCLSDAPFNINLNNCQIIYAQSYLRQKENLDILSCSIKTCVDQNGTIIKDISMININNNQQQNKIKCYNNKYQTNYECFTRCCQNSFKSIEECISYQKIKGIYQIIGIILIIMFLPCICLTVTFLCVFGTGLLMSPLSAIMFFRKKFRKTNIRDSQWISIQLQQISKLPQKQKECLICFQQSCDCILQCKHQFHLSCLNNWLKVQKSCPICRQKQKMTINYFCRKCSKQMYSFKTFQQVEQISQIKDCPQCQDKQKQNQSQITLEKGQTNQLNQIDHFV